MYLNLFRFGFNSFSDYLFKSTFSLMLLNNVLFMCALDFNRSSGKFNLFLKPSHKKSCQESCYLILNVEAIHEIEKSQNI